MDLYEILKQRKQEQVNNKEDTRYSKYTSFDKKYNTRKMATGLHNVIQLGVKYEEDKYIIPAYQRELVWSLENKQNLIKAIMQGSPIGEFIFAKEIIDMKDDYHIKWTIIDGQQRINSIREFISNKFKDSDDRYFKEYSYREMTYLIEEFTNFSAVYIEDLSEKEQIEIYLSKNTGGVVHTKTELQKAQDYMTSLNT